MAMVSFFKILNKVSLKKAPGHNHRNTMCQPGTVGDFSKISGKMLQI